MFSMNGGPSSLKSVVIPSTITTMGKELILLLFVIGISYFVIILGGSVFGFCSQLSDVTFVNGLTIIGSNILNMNGKDSALESLIIPSTVTSVGEELLVLT